MLDFFFLALLALEHSARAGHPRGADRLAAMLDAVESGINLDLTDPVGWRAELRQLVACASQQLAELPPLEPAGLVDVDPDRLIDRDSAAARLYQQWYTAHRIQQLVDAGDVGGALDMFDAAGAGDDEGITIRLGCDELLDGWPLVVERIRELRGQLGIDSADELLDLIEQMECPL